MGQASGECLCGQETLWHAIMRVNYFYVAHRGLDFQVQLLRLHFGGFACVVCGPTQSTAEGEVDLMEGRMASTPVLVVRAQFPAPVLLLFKRSQHRQRRRKYQIILAALCEYLDRKSLCCCRLDHILTFRW